MKPKTNNDRALNIITTLWAVLMIAAWVGYNQLAYSDWTCAFKRCVHASNIKP